MPTPTAVKAESGEGPATQGQGPSGAGPATQGPGPSGAGSLVAVEIFTGPHSRNADLRPTERLLRQDFSAPGGNPAAATTALASPFLRAPRQTPAGSAGPQVAGLGRGRCQQEVPAAGCADGSGLEDGGEAAAGARPPVSLFANSTKGLLQLSIALSTLINSIFVPDSSQFGMRLRCQRCRHRPGRRERCRGCGRDVGPCCLRAAGICVDCYEPEPEPGAAVWVVWFVHDMSSPGTRRRGTLPAGSNADGVLFCSRSRPTPGLSGASQGRDVCNFAARARKWRLLPKATSSGDGPRGSTVLEMLCGV